MPDGRTTRSSRLRQDEDFKSLGASDNLWESPAPPERRPAKMVEREEFLKNFWPWFEAMTRLIKVYADGDLPAAAVRAQEHAFTSGQIALSPFGALSGSMATS